MTTALIYDPIFLEHITPAHHPERPQRVQKAMLVLEALHWLERDGLVQLAPRPATVDELALVHDRNYIREVEAFSEEVAGEAKTGGSQSHFFTTDTYVSPKSYEAACMAAGAPLCRY